MKPMPRRILPVRLLFLPSIVSLSVGCGAISSLTGSSPSSGATIRGLVQGPAVAGASSTSDATGAGVRVSVEGTGLATTTDGGGRFVLEGVPDGTAVLRFQGSGLDARLEISGLASGQTLTITVQASGSRAVLTGGQEIEFTGAVEALTPPTLRVSGLNVTTTAETEIERAGSRVSLSSLRVGETVKVEGMLQADGSVLAREIKAQAGPAPTPTPTPGPTPTPSPTPTATPPPGRETEITGTVQSVTPPSLRVSGLTVLTNANTEIKRGDAKVPLSALQVGETVKVEGALQADGSVLAREIKAQAGPAPTPSPGPGAAVEFSGTIQSLTPPSLRVSGRTVVTHGGTEFKGEGRTHSLADFNVGDQVEVEGRSQPDGSVLADEIKRTRRAGN